jgi:hypothetical protein
MPSDEVVNPSPDGYFAELRGVETSSAATVQPVYRHQFLSTEIADRSDRRRALVVLVLSALGFVTAVPFAQVMLAQVNAFIPAYEAALILISAITAVMLFGQARWSGSRALLVLAAGFLYDALLIVPHALSFPDAFAPGGLLGGGQTTVWLFCFWHGGFPLFVTAYALLNAREGEPGRPDHGVDTALMGLTVLGTAALANGLTALGAYHDRLLPTLMNGNAQTQAATVALSATWVLGLIALGVLWRRSRHTVLDLWLMVMVVAWVFDIALSAVFNHQRFDLGFYAGRA